MIHRICSNCSSIESEDFMIRVDDDFFCIECDKKQERTSEMEMNISYKEAILLTSLIHREIDYQNKIKEVLKSLHREDEECINKDIITELSTKFGNLVYLYNVERNNLEKGIPS